MDCERYDNMKSFPGSFFFFFQTIMKSDGGTSQVTILVSEYNSNVSLSIQPCFDFFDQDIISC